MGFICSLRLLSNAIVSSHVDGAVMGVAGDCQYVLLSVIAPLQVLIASVELIKSHLLRRNVYSIFLRFLTDATG